MSPQARRLRWLVMAGGSATFVALWAATPRHVVVSGRSMLPGLATGDVVSLGWWQPWRHTPRRYERWLVRMPDGTALIKRIAGLPGEVVEVNGGDLLINGKRLLPSPHQLQETASRVTGGTWNTQVRDTVSWQEYRHLVEDASQRVDQAARLVPGPIYDGLDEDPDERRRLVPTANVGIAAIVERHPSAAAGDIYVRVGPQAAAIRLHAPGRHSVICGRVASRFVVAVKQLDEATQQKRLFPSSPIAWPVSEDWSLTSDAKPLVIGEGAPLMALGLEDAERARGTTTLHDITVWKTTHLLPAPDGKSRWTVPAEHVFLLGDHPAASRDSRHFGPVAASALVSSVQKLDRTTRRLVGPEH